LRWILRQRARRECRVFAAPDDREAPLLSGTGRREGLKKICPTGRAEYFDVEGLTGRIGVDRA